VVVLVGTKVGVSSHYLSLASTLTKIKEMHTVRVKLPYSPQRLEDEDAVGPDISPDTVLLPE
jgi:hypothetical protein